MNIIVSLDRLTVLYTAFSLIIGRNVILLPNEQGGRPFGFLFKWLQKWIERHPRSADALEIYPEIQRYLDIPGYCSLIDIFSKTEQKMNEYFRFDDANIDYSEYELYFKHITCVFSYNKYPLILFLHDIGKKNIDANTVFVTSDNFILELYGSYFDEELKIKSKILNGLSSKFNFLIYIFVYLYSLASVFRRISWQTLKSETVLLGADFAEDIRNIEMLGEMVDAPSDCKLVYRSYSQSVSSKVDPGDLPCCQLLDGAVYPENIFEYARLISADCWKIYCRARHLKEEHFFQLIKSPLKRINFRSLFNRYSFKYFWSRDDYNPEHILRTQELRRIGAVSMGINHGLPNPQLCLPHWRYMDYDIYYTFGEDLIKTKYGDMWPEEMKIRIVGSMGMTRERLKALSLNKPRPNDIIYFAGPEIGEDLIIKEVVKIAAAFPEKTVYIKNKRQNLKSKVFDSGLNNLVDTFEDSYDLMFKAKYALGGCSTVIAEAIQFGLCTYSFDFTGPDSESLYRTFPGLCVFSAQEVIDRITAIDSNKETYPRESFAGLIHLSPQWCIDIIREDMNLTPRLEIKSGIN